MENILFRRNLFFTLLMSWQFRVAESRQFCLMSKTSLPRDIKFNLKMITDNMCPKCFCFHKTTEHIMMYRLEKDLTPLTSDITLCVVCVFVTIFRCLMVANRSRTPHDDLCSLQRIHKEGPGLRIIFIYKVRCFIYRTYKGNVFNIAPEKANAWNTVCGINTYLFSCQFV